MHGRSKQEKHNTGKAYRYVVGAAGTGLLAFLWEGLRNSIPDHDLSLLGPAFFGPLSEYLRLEAEEIWAPCENAESGDPGDPGDPSGGPSDPDPGSQLSTPFLCTWNGNRFVFDNDFLLGSSTFYHSLEVGRRMYESGEVGHDLYRIQNSFVKKDGRLAFQIKEIEPEESFIDHLALTHVVYPKAGELFVDSKHRAFYVFDKDELKKRQGAVRQEIYVRGKKAAKALGDGGRAISGAERETEYLLDVGDTLEIQGAVERDAESVFLLLGSRYRDWTAGSIVPSRSVASSFYTDGIVSALGLSARFVPTFLLIGMVWFGGIVGNIVSVFWRGGDLRSTDSTVLSALNVPRAHADFTSPSPSGHSLLVESYWDWKQGEFQLAEVIHPRHNQYSVDAILLPKEAVSKEGKVRVRITATKRHYVGLASLFVPHAMFEGRAERLGVKKVYHQRERKNYTAVVNAHRSGEYLHTIPGDVVDVEFMPSSRQLGEDKQETYLFRASGFYTPLSKESRKKAGNWVDKLDNDSRELVKELQPLVIYKRSKKF